MNDITLIPVLAEEDIDGICRLEDAFKAEIGEAPLSPSARTALRAAIWAGRIRFFAAVHLSQLIGMCSVSETFSTFTCGKSGVFEDFYVRPPYRRQGVARRLARFAQDTCAREGFATLTVGAAQCDVPMYASLGFSTPIGTLLSCPLSQGAPGDRSVLTVEDPERKAAIARAILLALPVAL